MNNRLLYKTFYSFTNANYFAAIVGFVAAAVSIPMGGCRARRLGGGRSLVSADNVGVIVAAEPAVL